MEPEALEGVTYYPLTPSDETGGFDESRYRERLRMMKEYEFSGIFALGSLGEFAYLTIDERKQVAQATVDEMGDHFPVFVGTHGISTRKVLELSRHAQEVGADGILLNPQSYYQLTTEQVFQHYKTVHDAIDIPLFAYDGPTTGFEMDMDIAKKLAELERIEWLKAGTYDMRFFRELVLELGDELSLFAAPPHEFEKFAVGADGWASPMTNVAPQKSIEFYTAITNDEMDKARALYRELAPLFEIFEEVPLAIALKAMVKLQGFPMGDPRPPLQPLADSRKQQIKSILADIDLL